MATSNPTRATIRVANGRVELIADEGRILLSRQLPPPRRVGPLRWSYSSIARVRSEFVQHCLRHGIEVVGKEVV